jgi:hypothetical protein
MEVSGQLHAPVALTPETGPLGTHWIGVLQKFWSLQRAGHLVGHGTRGSPHISANLIAVERLCFTYLSFHKFRALAIGIINDVV